jgi:hypothetical protein
VRHIFNSLCWLYSIRACAQTDGEHLVHDKFISPTQFRIGCHGKAKHYSFPTTDCPAPAKIVGKGFPLGFPQVCQLGCTLRTVSQFYNLVNKVLINIPRPSAFTCLSCVLSGHPIFGCPRPIFKKSRRNIMQRIACFLFSAMIIATLTAWMPAPAAPTATPTEMPTATATYIPSPTATNTPTNTPELYELSFQAFHDDNGNGKMDEGEPVLVGVGNRISVE